MVKYSQEWLNYVSTGKDPKAFIVFKFGTSENITTNFTPVCADLVYMTPTTAEALEILSDNADDTVEGSGARVVTVEGIGDDFGLLSEDVTMNGTTAVALSNQFRRVFRIVVKESGTYANQTTGSHAGTITVRGAGAGSTWGTINLKNGFPLGASLIGAYTVPAGYTAHIIHEEVFVDSNKNVDLIFFRRENINDVTTPYSPMKATRVHLAKSADHTSASRTLGQAIPSMTDIGYMARGSSSPIVTLSFNILLIKEGYYP